MIDSLLTKKKKTKANLGQNRQKIRVISISSFSIYKAMCGATYFTAEVINLFT